MIREENWEFKNVDGYTTFAVIDLGEEYILEMIYNITQYLCMYDEFYNGDYNIKYVCTIYSPNEPLRVEFQTNLPYELFEINN